MENFSSEHPDVPVGLVSADFGLKSDVGMMILRRWLDLEGVDAVFDFPMSALALAAPMVFQIRTRSAWSPLQRPPT
jgi:branched-chain amino acid transport system substrate-binding protein